jgi:hypothetical protein
MPFPDISHPPAGHARATEPSVVIEKLHSNPLSSSLRRIYRTIPSLRNPGAPSDRRRGVGKSFPTIGKNTTKVSNHWKKRGGFSNHWKNIFQSLENFCGAGAPPGCAGEACKRLARARECGIGEGMKGGM